MPARKAPVDLASRDVLARVVGRSCNIDLLIEDIREELRGRPYDLVAGGWQHRTRKNHADAIRVAEGLSPDGAASKPLSQFESLALICVAYYQLITRAELGAFLAHFGLDTLRDLPNIEALEDAGLLNKAEIFGRNEPQPS